MLPEHISALTSGRSAALLKPWAALTAGVSPFPLQMGDPPGILNSPEFLNWEILAGDPSAKAQHTFGDPGSGAPAPHPSGNQWSWETKF